ncbi:hypothetical protein K505DRAFT_337204 [Melanomma pulvis-pyrius CBS 109.77]|uniref:Telomere replication protein EST3 n=1 Tax=Melanomma pulvis-pyrius CBS 109.77 TaxID=1314802 RepID=A0A6A6XD63_9PLEO|nr:hypothetical protein K505DRAFT_337204 [Melanomma pulvis-pyrius CBS 109.77]
MAMLAHLGRGCEGQGGGRRCSEKGDAGEISGEQHQRRNAERAEAAAAAAAADRAHHTSRQRQTAAAPWTRAAKPPSAPARPADTFGRRVQTPRPTFCALQRLPARPSAPRGCCRPSPSFAVQAVEPRLRCRPSVSAPPASSPCRDNPDAPRRDMPASPLRSWLDDSIATQLKLGHFWLSEQLQNKHEGVKPDPDGHWAGLYEDNGSVVDIINDVHPEQHSVVQIIGVPQVSPLLISDGDTCIEATVSGRCDRDFRRNHNGRHIAVDGLLSLVSVRRYTLRYTSYGPPRDHLRLILDALDSPAGQLAAVLGEPTSARASEAIRAVLQQLQETRSAADRRRWTMLQPMDTADDGGAYDASLDTQMPFGTQVAPPTRGQPAESGPAVMGARSLEPILAGNSPVEELSARDDDLGHRRDEDAARQNLLSLLGKGKNPQNAVPQRLPTVEHEATTLAVRSPQETRTTATVGERGSELSASPQQAVSRPRSTLNARRTEATEELTPASPTSNALEAPISPLLADAVAGAQETRHQDPKKRVSKPSPNMDAPASEPHWATAWQVSNESTSVPGDQRSLLSKPESRVDSSTLETALTTIAWQKPQPGHRFPDANIPIKVLRELRQLHEEHVAGDTNKEEESAPDCDLDFRADDDSLPSSDHEEDLPTSPVSWSKSPSPLPPNRPFQSDLPPDSSLGIDTNDPPPRRLTFTQTEPITAPPVQPPIEIDSSNDKDMEDPPSSPPAIQEEGSDEDMEMEVSVPRGLGEDGPEPSLRQDTEHIPTPTFGRTKSIVQVKETPYAKGKNGLFGSLISSPASTPTQTSSGEMKDASSASIVLGTYNVPQPSNPIGRLSRVGTHTGPPLSTPQLASQEHENRIKRPSFEVGRQAPELKRVQFPSNEAEDVSMLDASSDPTPLHKPSSYQPETSLTMTPIRSEIEDRETQFVQPEPSPISAQIPPREPKSSDEHNVSLPDNPTHVHVQVASPMRVESSIPGVDVRKRKMEESISKKSARRTKRRELKVVDFGEPSPPSKTATLYFRAQNEQSIERPTPNAETELPVEPAPDTNMEPSIVDGGKKSLADSIETAPALIATMQELDVDMEGPPLETTIQTARARSPSPIPHPKVPIESQNTKEVGTPKQAAPTVPTSVIAVPTLISSTHRQSPSWKDSAQELLTVVSQSDLTTIALEEHAISSTRPEDASLNDAISEQIVPIISDPSFTTSETSNVSPKTCRKDAVSVSASGVMIPSGDEASISLIREGPSHNDLQPRRTTTPPKEVEVLNGQTTKPGNRVCAEVMSDLNSLLRGHRSRSSSSHSEPRTHSRLKSSTSVPSLHTAETKSLKKPQLPLSAQDHGGLTVFQSFKQAYPEYTGNEKHFTGQCKQIQKLDQEDKMVSKWQWDDYLLRNRTDYLSYAMQCMGEGKDPEPYHRYYKDYIEETLYRKGILNKATVATALNEMEIDFPPVEVAAQLAPQRMSNSLSSSAMAAQLPSGAVSRHSQSAGHQPGSTIPAGRPRNIRDVFAPRVNPSAPRLRGHSTLPIDPPPISRRSTGTPQISRTNSTTSNPTSTTRDPIKSTGDAYNNFFNAKKRLMSWTGDSRVSQRPRLSEVPSPPTLPGSPTSEK